MGKHSPEIDAYIAAAQPFARPILKKLRTLFHKAEPRIEESIKWNCPHFTYKGMLGGFAAFKQHCTWGLWKSSILNDPHNIMGLKSGSMANAGKLTDVSQLPPDDAIIDLIRQAVSLNEQGISPPRKSGSARRPALKIPPALQAALKKDHAAATAFKAFSPSHQREYIEWITEAKKDETRDRRIAQTIQQVKARKSKEWK